MGTWGVKGGEITRTPPPPRFREGVTEAREAWSQTDPHFFNTCYMPSPHLIDVLYSSGQP